MCVPPPLLFEKTELEVYPKECAIFFPVFDGGIWPHAAVRVNLFFPCKGLDSRGSVSVAPVPYQFILEPGVDQFREFESPQTHAYSYLVVGTFSCAQIDLRKA